jgi:ubiquinone/menaquinone biosynthesis C-methylase UbiE
MSHTTGNTAALFERTAAHDFAADAPLHGTEKIRIETTLALIPPDVTSVLDVGCGPGTFLHRLPAHVTERFGTDLGTRGMRNARVPVFRSSVLRLPFADDSIDLVSCLEVLEHLPPADVPAAIAELSRVARKHVLVSTPHREQLLAASHRCPQCKAIFHVHGHLQSVTPDTLRPHFPAGATVHEHYASKSRHYQPALLKLRTLGLGAWKHSRNTFCPSCGNTEFANHEGGLRWKFVGALNHLIHPRRTKGNWLILRCDL